MIIGAGIIGLTSSYYISKFGNFEVTVVEKDYSIKSASEQNSNMTSIDIIKSLAGFGKCFVLDFMIIKNYFLSIFNDHKMKKLLGSLI